jgi:hypothetical protein
METQDLLTKMLADHNGWQQQITRIKEELKSLNNELAVIVSRFTPRDVPADVEHFQNQFIRQKEVLDILRHDFKQHENLLEALLKQPGKANVEDISALHHTQIQKLEDYIRIYDELKREFAEFASGEIAR